MSACVCRLMTPLRLCFYMPVFSFRSSIVLLASPFDSEPRLTSSPAFLAMAATVSQITAGALTLDLRALTVPALLLSSIVAACCPVVGMLINSRVLSSQIRLVRPSSLALRSLRTEVWPSDTNVDWSTNTNCIRLVQRRGIDIDAFFVGQRLNEALLQKEMRMCGGWFSGKCFNISTVVRCGGRRSRTSCFSVIGSPPVACNTATRHQPTTSLISVSSVVD